VKADRAPGRVELSCREHAGATSRREIASRCDVQSRIRDAVAIDRDIREERFQRSLALVAGLWSILSGLEVTYEHDRGSLRPACDVQAGHSQPGAVRRGSLRLWRSARGAHAVAGHCRGRPRRRHHRLGFHVRGIRRKPGGWPVSCAGSRERCRARTAVVGRSTRARASRSLRECGVHPRVRSATRHDAGPGVLRGKKTLTHSLGRQRRYAGEAA
jgi:hypothetical protein